MHPYKTKWLLRIILSALDALTHLDRNTFSGFFSGVVAVERAETVLGQHDPAPGDRRLLSPLPEVATLFV